MKVLSSFWGEPIELEEVEVHYSDNDLGRASIMRRPDGRFCIYQHWKASDRLHQLLTGTKEAVVPWRDDKTPIELLYEDVSPEVGIYGELKDARKEALRLLGCDSTEKQA